MLAVAALPSILLLPLTSVLRSLVYELPSSNCHKNDDP